MIRTHSVERLGKERMKEIVSFRYRNIVLKSILKLRKQELDVID